MKVLFKQELVSNNIIAQLLQEVELQSKIDHKYILRLRYVCQDSKRAYLITDIAPYGSLFNYLRRLTQFPENIAGKYMRQLLHALTYLHKKKIIHRKYIHLV